MITQFEEFPQFMRAVQDAVQTDDTHRNAGEARFHSFDDERTRISLASSTSSRSRARARETIGLVAREIERRVAQFKNSRRPLHRARGRGHSGRGATRRLAGTNRR